MQSVSKLLVRAGSILPTSPVGGPVRRLAQVDQVRKLYWKLVGEDSEYVTFNLSGRALTLPRSHALPGIRARHPQYSTNVGRVGAAVHAKYPGLHAVDIGANVGNTVAIFRAHARYPVLCIEGHPQFFELLERNTAGLDDIYLARTFVGEETGSLAGTVVSAGGTARLDADVSKGSQIAVKSLSEILREFPGFATAKMVKIDTDGMDVAIIFGATDVLQFAKPILFFEYIPDLAMTHLQNPIAVFDHLVELGYRYVTFWENTGDYLLSADLRNAALLQDIHAFYAGRGDSRYCDIAVFHEEDEDVWHMVRQGELEFFQRFRLPATDRNTNGSRSSP